MSASGNGFGLSPATGLAVKELIVDGECAVDISAFKFDRFRNVPQGLEKAVVMGGGGRTTPSTLGNGGTSWLRLHIKRTWLGSR